MLCKENKKKDIQDGIFFFNIPQNAVKSNSQAIGSQNKNHESKYFTIINTHRIKHTSQDIKNNNIHNILKTEVKTKDNSTNLRLLKSMKSFYDPDFVLNFRKNIKENYYSITNHNNNNNNYNNEINLNIANNKNEDPQKNNKENLHPRIFNIRNNNSCSHIQNLKLVVKSYSREKSDSKIKEGGMNLKTKMKNNQKVNPVNISNDTKLNFTDICSSKYGGNSENEHAIRGDYSIELKESDCIDIKKNPIKRITDSMFKEIIENSIANDLEKKNESRIKNNYPLNTEIKPKNEKIQKTSFNTMREPSNNTDKLHIKKNSKYKQFNILINYNQKRPNNSFNDPYTKSNNNKDCTKNEIIKPKTIEKNNQKHNSIKKNKTINNKLNNQKVNKSQDQQQKFNGFFFENNIPVINNNIFPCLKPESDESIEFPCTGTSDKNLPISKKNVGKLLIKTKDISSKFNNNASPFPYCKKNKTYLSNKVYGKTVKKYLTLENILEKNIKEKPQKSKFSKKNRGRNNNNIKFYKSDNLPCTKKENKNYGKIDNLQNFDCCQKIFIQKDLVKDNDFEFSTFNNKSSNLNRSPTFDNSNLLVFSKKGLLNRKKKIYKINKKKIKTNNLFPNHISNQKFKMNKNLLEIGLKNNKISIKKSLENYTHQNYINWKNCSYSEIDNKMLASNIKNEKINNSNTLKKKKKQGSKLGITINNAQQNKHIILKKNAQKMQKKDKKFNTYISHPTKMNNYLINNISIYRK